MGERGGRNMSVLKINNLHVSVDDKEILKGITLEFKTGETHALMGPNGNGKSTLLSTIMGHPSYQVTQGSITLDGEDLLAMSVDERSRKGIFLGMQYPEAIPGVTNSDFLKAAINARRDEPVRLFDFMNNLDQAISELKMNEDLAHRYLNEGFSGGEKKRNEILQMELLKPSFALLDEIDSGLDVDAVRTVSKGIEEYQKTQNGALLIITHSTRILESLHVDKAHIIVKGSIVHTGDASLVQEINENGFDKYIK